MTILFTFFGCSNDENVVDDDSSENLSLEKEIADVYERT